MIPSPTRRHLAYALLAAFGLGLPADPAHAAKARKPPRAKAAKERRGAAAPAPESPKAETPDPKAEYVTVPVDPNLPSEISIVPHFSPEQRDSNERREADRLRALAPRAQAWSRAFRAEGGPFARFVDETLRTLRSAIGRGSRNVCYPLAEATERLAAALPEAPEAQLESEIRAALSRVANGARICLEGRPTTAQTEIGRGAAVLARAAETIVHWGGR